MDNYIDIAKSLFEVAGLLRGRYSRFEYLKILLPFIVLRRTDYHLTANDTFKESISNPSCALDKLEEHLNSLPDSIHDTLLNRFDFANKIKELDSANLLHAVISHISKIDLDPKKIPNPEMGLIFEEIVNIFSKQNDGVIEEYFTPRAINRLLITLLFSQNAELSEDKNITKDIYDPACGIGGALSCAKEFLEEQNPNVKLNVYGQEINSETFGMCILDLAVRGMSTQNISCGNTFIEDAFPDKTFDFILSTPPFGLNWKNIKGYVEDEHKSQGQSGRFGAGLPRVSDGSLLFVQHMISKFKLNGGTSRIAVLLSGTPLLTGHAGTGESEIRKWIIENDWLEAIIALPQNILPHTAISTYIWIITNNKSPERKGKVQLIDAVDFYTSNIEKRGEGFNKLSQNHIDKIVKIYLEFEETEICKIYNNEDFGHVRISIETPKTREYELVSLKEDIQEYFKREVLPYSPKAKMDESKNKVGYELPLDFRSFTQFKILRKMEKLKTQYKDFESYKLKHISKNIFAIKSGEQHIKAENSIYIPSIGNSKVISNIDEASIKHHNYYQVVLEERYVLAEYLQQFFVSELGKSVLESLETSTFIPKLNKRDIGDAIVAICSIEEQESIISTVSKLDKLNKKIGEFSEELSLNPSSSIALQEQLDSMLDSLDLLSDADKIQAMVREGETKTIEFKQTLCMDVKTNKKEKYIGLAVLKTVAAFLNTEGGDLLIGVSDDGEILGTSEEIEKFFKNQDKYLLHFKSLLKDKIGAEFYDFVDYGFLKFKNTKVLRVQCRPANKPCFISNDNKEEFYVRTNPSTDKLDGRKLLEYVSTHFEN